MKVTLKCNRDLAEPRFIAKGEYVTLQYVSHIQCMNLYHMHMCVAMLCVCVCVCVYVAMCIIVCVCVCVGGGLFVTMYIAMYL